MVRTKNILIIVSVFLYFLFSCKENTIEPDLFGNILGIVLDADNNSAIVGASITTSPATNALVTDNTGKFQYSDIPVGSYIITVSKNNYEKTTVSVQVSDGETTAPTILLTKSSSGNTPPGEPSNPSPETNSVNQPVLLNLTWSASDPDASDSLWFDVYLYESNNPSQIKIASDITDTIVSVENLKFSTTYFWQVIVKDSKTTTNGSTWSFATMDVPDNPFLFASNKDGGYEIYSSDTTSNLLVRLTSNSYRDWFPRLNPSRTKIAFVSDEQVNPQIYTMDIDGSNIFRLTTIPVAGYHNNGFGFCWSPDGGQLIYPNYNKLFRIDQFGSNLTQIANAPADRNFRETDWSSVNNKIVVLTVGENPYDSEIYLMDSDGSNMTLFISNLPGCMEYPSFSVDGTSIMFTRDVSGFESQDGRQLDSHILIMNTNSTNPVDISFNKPDGTNDLQPRFSPDGAYIIFTNSSNVPGTTSDIWIMDVDGNNRNKVFENAIMPEWN